MRRMKLFLRVPAAAMVLLAGCGGTESPCVGVHATITTAYSMTPSCTSPVGVCTAGNVTSANLKGTTWFTALSSQPSSPSGVASYAGDLVITTADGTVTLRNSGLLNSSSGHYFEVEEVTSGTGAYLRATGQLVSQGIATATGPPSIGFAPELIRILEPRVQASTRSPCFLRPQRRSVTGN